jgi:hypothetical protein
VFDFTATGGSVIGLAVKGGPNTNFYDYRPNGVSSGTRLHAQVNPNNERFYGLSHVSFCYVPKARTKILTKVSADAITIGGSVTDTATLSGGNNPTGTITFKVYGPNDATCSGATVFTSTVTVNGNGNYTSGTFTPGAVGTYRWIASYSGDAKNTASSGACGDQNEQVVVRKATPRLGTAPNLLPNDRATLAGLVAPSGGALVFRLYLNGTCTGAPAYTETQVVNANGAFSTNKERGGHERVFGRADRHGLHPAQALAPQGPCAPGRGRPGTRCQPTGPGEQARPGESRWIIPARSRTPVPQAVSPDVK